MIKDSKNYLSLGLLILFAGAIPIFMAKGAPVIDNLSDPGFARGLITFIITLATIGLAFMLAYQAFFASDSSDDRFQRALKFLLN